MVPGMVACWFRTKPVLFIARKIEHVASDIVRLGTYILQGKINMRILMRALPPLVSINLFPVLIPPALCIMRARSTLASQAMDGDPVICTTNKRRARPHKHR